MRCATPNERFMSVPQCPILEGHAPSWPHFANGRDGARPSRQQIGLAKNFSLGNAAAVGHLTLANEIQPTRSLQRRRDRDHHHDHGAGIERSARNRPCRPETPAAGFPELRPELHLRRHLLEQSPPPAPLHQARHRWHPVGKPTPTLLALALPIHHRVGRRKPSRANTHRRLRLRAPHGRPRLLHPPTLHHGPTRTRLPPRRRRRERLERQNLAHPLFHRHPASVREPPDLQRPLRPRRPPLANPRPPHRTRTGNAGTGVNRPSSVFDKGHYRLTAFCHSRSMTVGKLPSRTASRITAPSKGTTRIRSLLPLSISLVTVDVKPFQEIKKPSEHRSDRFSSFLRKMTNSSFPHFPAQFLHSASISASSRRSLGSWLSLRILMSISSVAVRTRPVTVNPATFSNKRAIRDSNARPFWSVSLDISTALTDSVKGKASQPEIRWARSLTSLPTSVVACSAASSSRFPTLSACS